MNEFIRMFLRMFIQVGPYLVVFVVLGYIILYYSRLCRVKWLKAT